MTRHTQNQAAPGQAAIYGQFVPNEDNDGVGFINGELGDYVVGQYSLSGIDSTFVSVSIQDVMSFVEGDTPVAGHGLQNYPNPFNPVTYISFYLQEDDLVSLSIYDASGARVRVLKSAEVLAAGQNEVSWNGRDDRGQMVATGVYFYQLQAGHEIETKRMTLIK